MVPMGAVCTLRLISLIGSVLKQRSIGHGLLMWMGCLGSVVASDTGEVAG